MTNGAAWGVLLLRVVLGVVLVFHAYFGYANLAAPGVGPLVARLGVPAGYASPVAWAIVVAHVGGGLLIVLGLWTRTAALVNVPILAAALGILHWPGGWAARAVIVDVTVRKTVAVGYELSLLVLACTVAIMLIGAGPFSLDRGRTLPARRR